MTEAELILIFIGILDLLIAFGGLIVSILTHLEKKSKKKKA